MELKKVMIGAVGAGVLGALSLTAVAVAHRDTGMTGRTTVQMLGVAEAPAATNAMDGMSGMDTGMDAGKGQAATGEPAAARGLVRVTLRDVKGNRTGEVDIVPLVHGGNRVVVNAWNLTPGFHGIHIHAVGVCDPAGAKPFASAGGHFNPTGSAEGMQAGAFPVLLAGPNGVAQAEFLDADFHAGDLFGATGAAVVIHQLADNYANIPNRYTANGVAGPDMETQMTGDGGARVACGVVAKPKASPNPSPSPSVVTGKHY